MPSLVQLLALAPGAAALQQTLPDFKSPPAEYRAKFRYWFRDASLDHGILADDISALKDVGAGGLEFVPFYNYGFGGPGMEKWDVYGFGTPAFKDVFVTALESCDANDLVMDFALGASQGQGVPVEPLTPGLAVQLVYGKANVSGGATFQGTLPSPIIDWNEVPGYIQPQEKFGPNKLVAVTAAGIKSSSDSEVILDEESLIDLSDLVVDGELTWDAPSDHDDYVLFALYERYSNQRSCVGVPTDPIANGSWVTDHFSAAGTKLVTEFWEEHLLDDHVRGLLQSVGKHSWEDSMEIQATLYWTPDFIERFEAARGYSPIKFLPLLFHQATSYHANGPPYDTTYVLDAGESGQSKYLQDYRLTLNEGYQEYLGAYEEWAKSIGVTHSCQVAYNIPVDMLANIPLVSGPELESLGFPEIDQMLQFVGPAHLGGRNVVSTEIGAVPTGGYTLTLPALNNLFSDAFASGVNMMLVHGMQYGGDLDDGGMTTWPGYTPFQYMYSELWSPRQPAWEYMKEMMEYTARSQVVLQSGVAKRDVAFYLYKDPWTGATIFDGGDLRAEGFTYEYLSPANLVMEEATVTDGVLAAAGPAYRALVLDNHTYITAGASAALLDMAKEGLLIVVVGDLPSKTIGSSGQEAVAKNMKELASSELPNVKFLETSEELIAALHALSVAPRVSVDSSVPATAAKDLYTLWRADDDVDYVFLYNRGEEAADFGLVFEVEEGKVPVRFNPWTGEQQQILTYARSNSGIKVNFALRQDQTAIIAFVPGQGEASVVSHSDNIVEIQQDSEGKLSVLLDDPHAASLSLSNGRTEEISSLTEKTDAKLPSLVIGSWNLTIESWEPESADSNKTHSAKRPMYLGLQDSLRPWSDIPEAQNVSGIGFYSATFNSPRLCQLPHAQTATIIDFGVVHNSLRAWVNDKQIPAVDMMDAKLDISEYVLQGENSIRVEVASTLFNAVKARLDWVKNSGVGPLNPALYSGVDWQPHGLVGPVRVSTLRKVLV